MRPTTRKILLSHLLLFCCLVPQTNPIKLTFSANISITESRQNFLREMTLEAWNAYEKYAWGADCLKPSTRSPYNMDFGPTSGHTIVAAMSTLWTMGLMEQFDRGRRWIAEELNFGAIDEQVNVHATVTDYIGGLLSVYALSGDEMFLDKAVEIANTLEPAWRTPTDLPSESVNPKQGFHLGHKNTLSGVGGNQLEFSYLAQLTGNQTYTSRIRKLRQFLKKKIANQYLASSLGYMDILDVHLGDWFYTTDPLNLDHTYLTLSLFTNGRDYYNSLLKCYIQSNGKDTEALEMFKDVIQMALNVKLFAASNTSLIYTRAYYYNNNKYGDYMTYDGCYLGGSLALGASFIEETLSRNRSIDGSVRRQELIRIAQARILAEGLTETCQAASKATNTGLGPEKMYFNEHEDGTNLSGGRLNALFERSYSLTPELAEAYLLLYRITKDPKYRVYAWELAQAIYKHSRIAEIGAYSTIADVDQIPTNKFAGHQPAIFFSATLKYLYLIFADDDVLALDQWVFNSAGHPLPIDK